MTARRPPTHDVAIVEAALLEFVAELHPERLDSTSLVGRILSERADPGEVRTAERAMANLAEFGLIRRGEREVVEPTPPGLRAVALLT